MNNLNNVLKAANKVLLYPSTTLVESCREFGVKISPNSGLLIGGFIPPAVTLTLWIINKIKNNQKKRQEKEKMKNEIIRKQQAIIQKLKTENELNQQEIKNLKDTLMMLDDAVSKLNVA